MLSTSFSFSHSQRIFLLIATGPLKMVGTRRSSALASGSAGGVSERPRKRAKFGSSMVEDSGTTDLLGPPTTKRVKAGVKKEIDKNLLPERASIPWKVGAHVSAAGGLENAVLNAAEIGANAFAIFLKSQRKWTSPSLAPETITSFKSRMKEFGYSSSLVLPHGSYLINLGNPDDDKRQKSYECFLDDLKRCEQLGLTLYNFHPGSTVGATTTAGSISLIAQCINRAHKETSFVSVVLENMAGAGNIVGSNFSHLADIISEVEDKSRVGVCLDTCHMFAAGYDIRTKSAWSATLDKFESQVGLSYLRGMHLNDSKTGLSSKRDRHENIGIGHIGLQAFHHILNDPRVQNIPLILETPSFEKPKDVWAKEIEVLHRLSGLVLEANDEISQLTEDIRGRVKEADAAGKNKIKPKAKARKRSKKDEETDDEENSG